jgi:hypothetical protein
MSSMQQQQTWIDAVLAMPWIAWSVGGLLIAFGTAATIGTA